MVFDIEKTIMGYLYNIFYQRHVPVSYPSLKKRCNGSVVEHFFERLGYRIVIVAFVTLVGAGIKSMKK